LVEGGLLNASLMSCTSHLRCLQVRLAEVLLDRVQRDAGCGERGRNSVAQVVEADLADTGLRARRLESRGDLGAVERDPELRMGQHEVVFVAEHGAQTPLLQLADDPVRHRHASYMSSLECS
jgi:hypothetical protein